LAIDHFRPWTASESLPSGEGVFGNVCRPIEFDPAWRSAGVAGLARAIEESGDFDGMPALGDALEEAGCARPEILDHCRSPGGHVRGCWVVDAVLGIRAG